MKPGSEPGVTDMADDRLDFEEIFLRLEISNYLGTRQGVAWENDYNCMIGILELCNGMTMAEVTRRLTENSKPLIKAIELILERVNRSGATPSWELSENEISNMLTEINILAKQGLRESKEAPDAKKG